MPSLLFALGFGLGVLACVLADAVDKLRTAKRHDVYFGPVFHGAEHLRDVASRRLTVAPMYRSNNSAGYLLTPMDHTFQDSTLPAKDS